MITDCMFQHLDNFVNEELVQVWAFSNVPLAKRQNPNKVYGAPRCLYLVEI